MNIMNRASQILTAIIISTWVSSCLFADQPELSSATVGIQSVWKPGVWTPVVVPESVSASPLVAIEAADDDGVWVEYPVSKSDDGNYRALVRSSKRQGAVQLLFEDKTVKKLSLPAPAQSHREVVLVIGTESESEFVRLSITHTDVDPAHRPVVVQIDTIDQLRSQLVPDNALSLQVVDRIVWFHKPGTDLTAPELVEWLRLGGDVTLSTLDIEKAGAFLNSLQPESVSRADAASQQTEYYLNQTRSLEQYAGSDQPIPKLGFGQRYNLRAVRLPVSADAVVECSFMDLPLIYRQAIGFGRLTVAAIDLNAEQIQKWSNRERFLRRVLDISETSSQVQRYSANAILHYGYDDLSGQLASGLNQYKDVAIPSFWLVAAVLIVFIVLIGAGDYFLWRKLRLPTWITWISFPIYIAVFCGLFYWMSRTQSGSAVRTNWAGVVDVDYASGMTQSFLYGDVLTPQADVYSLAFESLDKNSALTGKTTWFGSTGQGISGMNQAHSSVNSEWKPQVKELTINTEQLASDPSYTINAASRATRNVFCRSVDSQDELQKALSFSVKEVQGKLSGTISNQTKDVTFSECLLVYNQWAFPVGTFKPGETITVDDSLQRYSLDAVLVGKRVQMPDLSVMYSNETILYNPMGLDPEEPLRAMLFYKTSGGAEYVKLDSGYQSPTDFSSLVKLRRAVLLCKVSPDQAKKIIRLRVTQNGSDTASSQSSDDCRLLFYRFVLPLNE